MVVIVVVCGNNVSVSHHFFDTITFRMYVTACRAPDLEKSSHFWKTVAIIDHRYFPIRVYTQRN